MGLFEYGRRLPAIQPSWQRRGRWIFVTRKRNLDRCSHSYRRCPRKILWIYIYINIYVSSFLFPLFSNDSKCAACRSHTKLRGYNWIPGGYTRSDLNIREDLDPYQDIWRYTRPDLSVRGCLDPAGTDATGTRVPARFEELRFLIFIYCRNCLY